jgi:hypothetical protein
MGIATFRAMVGVSDTILESRSRYWAKYCLEEGATLIKTGRGCSQAWALVVATALLG